VPAQSRREHLVQVCFKYNWQGLRFLVLVHLGHWKAGSSSLTGLQASTAASVISLCPVLNHRDRNTIEEPEHPGGDATCDPKNAAETSRCQNTWSARGQVAHKLFEFLIRRPAGQCHDVEAPGEQDISVDRVTGLGDTDADKRELELVAEIPQRVKTLRRRIAERLR
jgi:hypothetical protein